MADKKDSQKEFSTCFEELPFAEMMQKMMSQARVGSLCAEMMQKTRKHQKEGASFNCSEMMQKIKMKDCRKVQEEPEKSKEEVCHGRKE